MKKKCKVVMLPTEKATWPNCIWLGRISKQLNLDTSYNRHPKSINPIDNSMLPQHLYIVSNEEIRINDYVIDSMGELFGPYESGDIIGKDAKKIIASTDKPLKLPEPSPEFIAAFILAYNEGNIITKVMVEYETELEAYYRNGIGGAQLKVDKNNCITITKVKDSWSREEVISILKEARKHTYNGYSLDKWIEENL